jgi:hypothetical protein
MTGSSALRMARKSSVGREARPQPVHIHKGTCAQLDAKPAYGLTTLADGKSETVIDQPPSTRQRERFAINGHKSAQEATTYVFCGDIPLK